MLQLRTLATLGGGDYGWLKARHHFAVDERGNPAHGRLGSLVVWNDHEDTSGGQGEIRAGNAQAFSAGRGVRHSESNSNSPETHMQDSNRYLPLLGRALIALPFMLSGIGKLAAPAAALGYIRAVGLPFPQLGLVIALTVELGFATLLLIGYRVRPVAIVLALFCLATAVFFHRNFADQSQMINFLKNVMILGGLLQIVYFGAGPLSIEAARKPVSA